MKLAVKRRKMRKIGGAFLSLLGTLAHLCGNNAFCVLVAGESHAMIDDLRERIAVARGHRKADLVLRGCRVVNVFSGAIERRDVAIHRGKVVGLGPYDGKTVINASSKIILPGFIDSHVHLESSLLVPAEFVKAALPRGVTGVVADPHEIANVLGREGIGYFLRATGGWPLDF